MADLREAILDFCALRGADPMWVQGAGGNVSWKQEDALWIKASGAWLADARQADIFLPVALPALRRSLEDADFAVTARPLQATGLRPSIETALHALMPHPVVAHMHSIPVLAHLVRSDCDATIAERLQDAPFAHTSVSYFKPGADLARGVHAALQRTPDAEVVFLKNHGVVVGGPDVASVDARLQALNTTFATPGPLDLGPLQAADGIAPYRPIADAQLHRLATEAHLLQAVEEHWALYPDHVVFLGAAAAVFDGWDALRAHEASGHARPELCFIRGEGVYVLASFTRAKLVQLRCYYDVIAREPDLLKLRSLTDAEVGALLNWDAERYRMQLQKK